MKDDFKQEVLLLITWLHWKFYLLIRGNILTWIQNGSDLEVILRKKTVLKILMYVVCKVCTDSDRCPLLFPKYIYMYISEVDDDYSGMFMRFLVIRFRRTENSYIGISGD